MKAPAQTVLANALRLFFSEHLPLTRGLSPHTVLSYRDAFVILLPYLAQRHRCAVVDLDICHLGPNELIAFLDHLEKERGNSAVTRNTRLAAIHSFARYLALGHPECVAVAQRILAVPMKRTRTHAVQYLEAEEIRAMLDTVTSRNIEGLRDRALLLTLFNTGARVQELINVRPCDLQLERPYQIRLFGKGRKERVCPLWADTVTALRKLLAAAPERAAATTPIFRNRRGEPLTRFGVRYVLRQYAQRAQRRAPGLTTKAVHPHTFRHSAAVHLLRSGVDLVTISHWLGHASIETTNRYAAVDLETKREALERAGSISTTTDAEAASWHTDDSILQWLERL